MSKAVLDSSALIAVMTKECGGDLVLAVLQAAVISTVNLAEVISFFSTAGIPGAKTLDAVLGMRLAIAEFTAEQARMAGDLRAQTKAFGLSLGDRACLALALELGLPVYTADRVWAQLPGFEVVLIRS